MGVRDFLTFFPLGSGGQTTQPILTQNGSNGVDSRKDELFAIKIETFHTPDLQGPKKVKISQISVNQGSFKLD